MSLEEDIAKKLTDICKNEFKKYKDDDLLTLSRRLGVLPSEIAYLLVKGSWDIKAAIYIAEKLGLDFDIKVKKVKEEYRTFDS